MSTPSDNLKVSFHTLGCKLNFAETSVIGKLLADKGFIRVPEYENPDICIVNTCSVTETADKKGRRLIRHLHTINPDAAIVVTGCYAQLKPRQVAELPGVAIVAGNDEKLLLDSFIDSWLASRKPLASVIPARDIREFRPACERGDRTRWFLKVQDGCDCWCTYCTIPAARGRSRSGCIPDLVAQARHVADSGGREIVLTGINIGDFGKGRDDTFLDLIQALDQVEGIARYRISSIEPDLLTPQIIEWIASSSRAFMPHFHIPLQSGSDAVLSLMRRRYDTTLFASRIQLLRSLIPDCFIGVDIMAGARGETPDEWRRSLEFVSSLPVQQLHVFPYSERPGTRALTIDHIVPQEEKHRRVAALMRISDTKHDAFRRKADGSVRPVLWEAPHAGSELMYGFTDNYLRVAAPLRHDLVNTITPARLSLGDHGSEVMRADILC